MSTLRITPLPDGRKTLSGATFHVKDAIKAASLAAGAAAVWDPAAKTWTVATGTDLSTIVTPPSSSGAPAPRAPKPQPRAREDWTREEWQNYCLRRRGNSGPCCCHAEAFWEYAQGPTQYRCERHGQTHNNWTGD